MKNHYIGIVSKIPEKGKKLVVRRTPGIERNGEVTYKVHVITNILSVQELKSDDHRTFAVETENSVYYVHVVS